MNEIIPSLPALLASLPGPTEHLLAAVIALLAYVLTSRAERERRAPSVAIGWVLGMIFAPYLAFPLYFLFGRRKLVRSPRQRLPAAADAHWAAVLLAGFGMPPPARGAVRMHHDGAEALEGLWRTLARARTRLDICSYLLGRDAFAQALCDRLIERAQAGVKVRVLLDAYGAWLGDRRMWKNLRAAGVELRMFRPLSLRYSDGPRNLRMHRKLCVADGEWLWSGGRNLAVEYFLGTDQQPAWIDLSFEVEGDTAVDAAHQFELDWGIARGSTLIATVRACVEAQTGALTQYLPSGPDQAEDTLRALIIEGCYRADRRILAITPYFVPDEGVLAALRLAACRGVQVSLCLPLRSNHRLADFARNRALRELSAAGVGIRLLPRMLHAKALVFDDNLALVGSANLDPRSLLLNHEAMTVFYAPENIEWIANWIGAYAAQGQLFIAKRPGIFRDMGEGLVLTVAFQL